MFSWSSETSTTAEDLAETDSSRGILSNFALSSEATTSATTTAAAAATDSPVAAAAAAKSWFRDVLDAVLLIALLHLVNVGFRWWNAKRLRKNHVSCNSSTASTAVVSSASASPLMKGGNKLTNRFAKTLQKFQKKTKKKKNARFQLNGFSKDDDDITSTTRTSNVSEAATHNNSFQRYYPTRYNKNALPKQEQQRRSSMGRTWTIPQGNGMRPVVLNFATTNLEECLDQVDLLEMCGVVNDEFEVVDILVKWCSQERIYFENYGAVACYLCQNNSMTPRHSNTQQAQQLYQSPAAARLYSRSKWRQALERKFASCYRKDTKKLRKLRNMAMFFSHLLATNAISYQIFDIVKLSEAQTTTASRYFLKILLKDLASHLTLPRLQRRIQEFPHAFAGFCLLNPPNNNNNNHISSGSSTGSHGSSSKISRRASVTSTTSTLTSYTTHSVLHNVKNMKFAVHFLTEIGLKPLSMDMRDHLLKLEKEQRESIQRQRKDKIMNTPGAKKKKLILEVSEHSRYGGQLLHEEDIPNISNHSVVTDEEASSIGSSINSTSIQSLEQDRPLNTAPAISSSNHSVISQLSNSTRSRSTSHRKTAMNTPHLKNSFGSLAEISDHNSHHSRESLGGKSGSSAAKKVRSSHRKLSRRIVPHTNLLASRNMAAPQTPQGYKRNLFGTSTAPGSSSRLTESLSPKPTRTQPSQRRRLPNAPNLDRSNSIERLFQKGQKQDDDDGVKSTSSTDSEIVPPPRCGAAGVVSGDDEYYETEYNDISQKDDDDDDDSEDLKDDVETDSFDYDDYYGNDNLGKQQQQHHPEDTDGSVDSFHLPSDDEKEDQQQDFYNRRGVAFRKRPSVINEDIEV